jgi:hypothetical protein
MTQENGKVQIGRVGTKWPLYVWFDDSCGEQLKSVFMEQAVELTIATVRADFDFDHPLTGRLAVGAVACIWYEEEKSDMDLSVIPIWDLDDYLRNPDNYVAMVIEIIDSDWMGVFGDERDAFEGFMAAELPNQTSRYLM